MKTAMNSELLRQQFERAKEHYEQVNAKERASKKRWIYACRTAATSIVLFLGGAGLEATTTFFKDTIPSRLSDGLCYMSDVLRSNQYPRQYTIVLLPFKNDNDGGRRRDVAASLLSTVYDVNAISPCEPVELGIKGGKLNNKRAYTQNIENVFTKYGADLVVRGEVKQQTVLIDGFTRSDVKRQPELEKGGQIDSSIHDLTAQLGKENIFDAGNADDASKFLQINIPLALNVALSDVTCSDLILTECTYPDKMNVPDDVMHIVAKVDMIFSTEGSDERAELAERGLGLRENSDYYLALGQYQKLMKGSQTALMSPKTLPIIINLIYRFDKNTYVNAEGAQKSLFELATEIISEVDRQDWRLDSMSALLDQRVGETCKSADNLKKSIVHFKRAIKGIEEKQLNVSTESFAWLSLWRSQALLFVLAGDNDKKVLRQDLSETVTHLESAHIDWTKERESDKKVRFESELAATLKLNELMKSPSGITVASLNIASSNLCPR
jgi:hypothetical protein